MTRRPPTPTPTLTPTSPVPQGTGTLQVLRGQPAPVSAAGGDAVELILDTPGTMLQTLPDGQSKIDDAKAVLTNLVSTTLPPNTPLALRVFGTVPGSCDTSLAVPLAPLDPAAVSGQINQIPAVDEVKTPIGAALQFVAQDLQAANGPKVVVLVTDGEETCGGDPAAAIDGLIAAGIEVHVNIVGLALDDPALQQQYRDLARRTDGGYFDAASQADLSAAIAQAVRAPFRVQDASGRVVATGIVGGSPIPVPAGTYTVGVLTDPIHTVDQVPVEPGKLTRVQFATSIERDWRSRRITASRTSVRAVGATHASPVPGSLATDATGRRVRRPYQEIRP